MKICLISSLCYGLFHPENKKALPFGGAEVQQFYLGTALSKSPNGEVSFIVGDFCPEQATLESVTLEGHEVRIHKGIKYYNRVFLFDSILDIVRLHRAMKALQADVYVLRGGGSLAGIVAFLARKVFRKKFIYSSAHDRDSNLDFFRDHCFSVNWSFRYGLRNANAIVCQHRGQQRIFKKKLNFDAHVIKTMYPMEPRGKAATMKRKHILWVSRLVSWKRPKTFVELAKRFPEEKFLLITNSESSDFVDDMRSVANLEIRKSLPLGEMDDYFRRAKVFVNTSVAEGFPNTFVQAAKNATPILSLKVNPEGIIEYYQIGKCSGDNFEKLVLDLSEMLKDKNLWQKMSKNAYNYAKQHHDWNKIVKDYLTLFQQ